MIGLKNGWQLFSALLYRWWYYSQRAYTLKFITIRQLPDQLEYVKGPLPLENNKYHEKKWERLRISLRKWGMLRPLLVMSLETHTTEGEVEYHLLDGRHRLYLWIKDNPYNTVQIPVCIKRLTTREIKERNKIEKHKEDIKSQLKLLNTNEKN